MNRQLETLVTLLLWGMVRVVKCSNVSIPNMDLYTIDTPIIATVPYSRTESVVKRDRSLAASLSNENRHNIPTYPQSVDFELVGARWRNVEYKRSLLQSFKSRDLEYQAPPPGQLNSNQRYLVYVDDASPLRLRKVQRLESRAFVRQYKGRYVIQVGVFKQKVAAKQQVRELKSRGIGAQLVSLSRREAMKLGQENYFVVIPSSRRDLPLLDERVKRLQADTTDNTVVVSRREWPLGPHIRVGPFLEREQAERWQRYLQKMGLGQARVYYGV